MTVPQLDRVRGIALALPAVNERQSHGAPCFFVRDKRPLCYYHDDHRGDGRVSIWCPVQTELQGVLVANHPNRFFRPPTSTRGTFSGWLGVFLDTPGLNNVDWVEIAALLEDAFRLVAPRNLIAELDNRNQTTTKG